MQPQRRKSSSTNEPIAIVGSGCRFPGESSTPSKLWELLRQPRDLLTKIPTDRFSAKGFYHPDGLHHGASNVQDSYFLSENVRHFDAQFFGIKPVEANAIDPQQRLLLETVYDSVEDAGLTIEGLQGSKTAVYVGLMCQDYEPMILRDTDSIPTYHATGNARSIMSNRISYFFDWRGPSMTIDTACSSSLVAVHQAVQALRAGDSRVAVAAGSNLILGPENYIGESKLKMLSPTGRSRMWDEAADGYARGEGVAAVLLKTLSAAQEDGDHIECIIRETGINQDGRTKGITMPSSTAQATLIRDTYAKAGLDITTHAGRPQYFEAHGTGTPAGDPIEAEAINTAFFGSSDRNCLHESGECDVLYVGSIKTVIGHTEGTAGLASLLKASLALQNGIIPPNMLFSRLNPNVEPFYNNLKIPTTAVDWPALATGQPRRASVNCFGFGGANAHAILESYEPEDTTFCAAVDAQEPLVYVPFIFSANSERSLTDNLRSYSAFLRTNRTINLRNLAWTLNVRRSTFPIRVTFAATTVETLVGKIDAKLEGLLKDSNSSIGIRSLVGSNRPRILGVFTGQGAQWAHMGRELMIASDYVRSLIRGLEARLGELPAADRPSWSLQELFMNASSTQISEAAVSQPLCTAIQIVLVDLLRSCGIEFEAVVGHSSGEIGAAYAAGYISAHDAICIAHYRGVHTKLAVGSQGQKGAMLAVGTSFEDATELCQLPRFAGRITVAASNSSASVTLSGDADAIARAKVVFEDEKRFVRLLIVNKAYHSHHMIPCSEPYIRSLRACKIKVQKPTNTSCTWISSVYGEEIDNGPEMLKDIYWESNMVNPVLFSQALERAYTIKGPFDIAAEVGPHPALKGPASQVIQDISGGDSVPYTGLLSRGKHDVEMFADGLGFLWAHTNAVDLNAYDKTISGGATSSLLKSLPTYSWEHDRVFWHESRLSRAHRTREHYVHELLGHRIPDGVEHQLQWRNLLRPKEVPWINDHQLQDQVVFPAAGYVVMALEASKHVDGKKPISLIEVQDFVIHQAMIFNDEQTGLETLFTLTDISKDKNRASANFTYYSAMSKESDNMTLMAGGRLQIRFGEQSPSLLPSMSSPQPNMVEVEEDRFYSSLSDLGYGYTGPFRALSSLKRKLGVATGLVAKPSAINPLMVHPAMLDAAIQSVILAYCYPKDGRLWSLHLPTSIRKVVVNPLLCTASPDKTALLPFDAALSDEEGRAVYGDVAVFTEDGKHAILQIEGMHAVPFSGATAGNDTHIFSQTVWNFAVPNGEAIAWDGRAAPEDYDLALILERVASFYLRNLEREIPLGHPGRSNEAYQGYFRFMSHVNFLVSSGRHRYAKQDWLQDTLAQIMSESAKYPDSLDLRIMHVVGQQMPAVVRGETTILEHLTQDNLLNDYYQNALGFPLYTRFLARMVSQISNRYPHMNIIELGAGTGGGTKGIFKEMGGTFSSYTFTDISNGFFEKAQEVFDEYEDKMIFKVLDIEKDPVAQGYPAHFYDLVVASMVLHATRDLEHTLKNVRRLLKPGGYLVMMEMTDNDPIRSGFIFGSLPGWWLGAGDDRVLSPCIAPAQWGMLLEKAGFSGIDAITPDLDPLPFPASIIASQALDDNITLLREPLYPSANIVPSGNSFQNLLLIGGKTLKTSKVISQLRGLLSRSYGKITSLSSLEDVGITEVLSGTTILSLTDLDWPVFEAITAERFQGLKKAFEQKTVLWITEGCRADCPYMNSTVGFGRSQMCESPDLRLQFLDVDRSDKLDARILAEVLLRLQLQDMWTQGGLQNTMLYSTEPELVLEQGQLLIPRLKVNQAANDRYNSSRRAITKALDPKKSSVAVRYSGSSYSLHEGRDCENKELVTIRVRYSLISSIKLSSAGYWFLLLGRSNAGKDALVVSETHESIVQVPQTQVIECDIPSGREKDVLSATACNLLALSIISEMAAHETLLVHGADALIAAILTRWTAEKGIRLVQTINSLNCQDASRIAIHPQTTKREIKSMLPDNISVLVNLSAGVDSEDVVENILAILPPHARIETTSTLFKTYAHATATATTGLLPKLLRAAWKNLNSGQFLSYSQKEWQWLAVNEILSNETLQDPRRILDWTTTATVPVSIEPVDTKSMFADDRTYWLLGLTGGLGISLCEWMIRHGARYVVLTSRNPNIDKSWLQSMNAGSATVKVYASDVTSRDNLRAVYEEIRSALPPVAGVAQGAMVLRDVPIRDMTYDNMVDVLKPKLHGSIYLDEIFSDDVLDFLIFFSSMTGVMGNPGQANYSAANQFMASLAAQRRKRGLAASVINIGAIIGVGYVTREVSQAGQDNLRKGGYMWMSERDFHQIFAEAVLASPPNSAQDPDISTGLIRVNALDAYKPMWFDNPKFSQFVVQQAVAGCSSVSKIGVSVKSLLQVATSQEQVFEVLQDSFTTKLQNMLQLDANGDEDKTAMINLRAEDIGIDSLIAVEIRSWFLKNVNVNVPVLKILGGASIRDLLDHVMANLPAELVPNLLQINDSQSTLVPTLMLDKQVTYLAPPTSTPNAGSSSASEVGDSSNTSEKSSSATSPDDSENEKEPSDLPTSASRKAEPMSFGQSMFWFVNMYLHDQTTLNHTGIYQMKGYLRTKELENAVQVVGQRHEALRTRFFMNDEQKPMQAVVDTPVLHLERKKILGKHEADEYLQAVKNYVYDLKRGETMRILLLTQSPTQHYLIIGCHHINIDGISHQVLMNDLEKAYNRQTLNPNVLQYPDFARRQRDEYKEGKWRNELAYWHNEFPDIPQPMQLLPLSEAISRQILTEYAVHRIDFRIDANISTRIQQVSRQYKATPFHFYLAAFKALLLRFIEVDDLCIGMGDGNRIDDDTLEGIGPFVNILPIRFRHRKTDTFGDALKEARSKTYSALANSRVPFEVLLNELAVPRSASHSPLFQTFIDYRQGAREKQSFGNCELKLQEFVAGRTAYDISLDIVDNPGTGSDSLIMLMVQKHLYTPRHAEILANTYLHLLEEFSKNTDLKLHEPAIYSRADTEKAIKLGRGPIHLSGWPETLAHQIDSIVAQSGEQPAVKDGKGNMLTYNEMSQRANSIATALRTANIGAGSRVAVFQEPTTDWICSILAIMRIGAIYLPLDLATPLSRLSVIANDCQPSAIVLHAATETSFPALKLQSAQVINISGISFSIPGGVPNLARSESPAVIFYTSGSTGTPKGIVLKHSNLVNEIECSASIYQFGAESVLQQSAFSFDMSLTQIFTAIAYGGIVHVVSREVRADPIALTNLMASEAISFTGATPTEYMSWLRYGNLDALRKSKWIRAVVGGEQITDAFMQELQILAKTGLRVFNAYGPTEVTCSSNKLELSYKDLVSKERVSAGFPSPNTSVYIVDAEMRPVPIGVPGEIVVGGAGVASGYLNNEELTSQKFVFDVFAPEEYISRGWTVMHKTGDRGRWRPNGSIVIDGRIAEDTQIKLRGLRIDLRDVEMALLRAAKGELAEAVVSVRNVQSSTLQILVAHVVYSPECPPEHRQSLLEQLPAILDLPQYMCPAIVIPLDKMPMSNSSKLDRRAINCLPLPPSVAKVAAITQLTDVEAELKSVWEEVLSKDIVNYHVINTESDFFHVGGNSLLLVRLQALIKKTFHVSMPLVQLFESSTLRTMNSRIQCRKGNSRALLDWEAETQLPVDILDFCKSTEPVIQTGSPRILVLTGATGFLGKELLQQLVTDEKVAKIFCIAVRQTLVRDPLFDNEKVVIFRGDLTLPRLGLSEQDATTIFSEADAVIHNAAEVSHLKSYHTLRSANVGSTIELIRLSLPQQLPFHYISTAGVALLSGKAIFEEVTASPYPPPVDGSDGYTASKWASERFLEKFSKQGRLSIRIHRPSNIAREDFPELDLLQNLLKYSRLMKAVPLSSKLQGALDIVSVEHCARDIIQEVYDTAAQRSAGSLKYLHLSGDVSIPLAGLKAFLDQEVAGDYVVLSMAEWAEKARSLGLHSVVAAFFENVETAAEVVTFPRLVRNRLGEEA